MKTQRISIIILLFSIGCRPSLPDRPYFANPILPAPSQDPWMTYHEEFYYYCESQGASIIIRKASRIHEIGADPGKKVWSAPESGPFSKNVWAPELHRIDVRWYIYFAADDGTNANHRMWVLSSEKDSPYGPFNPPHELNTQGWAIDGTPVFDETLRLHFIWSGWPGDRDGTQNLYIAPMMNPWKIDTPRVLLSEPTEEWERKGMPICEGPEALKLGDRILLTYSGSASWTADYCLGLLVHTGGSVLDPTTWRKTGPVFERSESVWGVGHCSFVKSPDGTEDWMLYHAKESPRDGWDDRSVRAQRFSWTRQGVPDFGRPVPAGGPVPIPSEDNLRK